MPKALLVFFIKEDMLVKATGIVRRIDDLGRIVIPKEIRRTLRIREGDPLLTTLLLTENTVNKRFLKETFAAVIGQIEKRIGAI